MNDSPRRSRRPSDDDEDAPRSRRDRSRDEDEEEELPRRRRSSGRQEEDDPEDREDDRPAAKRKSRSRDEDDEEEREERPRRPRRSASVQAMDNRVKLLIAGGIGVLVVVVLVAVGIFMMVRSAKRAPFRPQLATYTAAPTGNAPPGTRVKKVVVVDVKDNDVDGLHFDLPDDLRASGPGEVTAVVQLAWDKRQVGTYSSGGNAYQWFCDVTVIDLATRAKVAGQQISGSRPPAMVRGKRGQSHTGDKPTDAVLTFIKGLPRG